MSTKILYNGYVPIEYINNIPNDNRCNVENFKYIAIEYISRIYQENIEDDYEFLESIADQMEEQGRDLSDRDRDNFLNGNIQDISLKGLVDFMGGRIVNNQQDGKKRRSKKKSKRRSKKKSKRRSKRKSKRRSK